LPERRGIADLHRRAEVSQKATERYLDASVDQTATVAELAQDLTQAVNWNGQRVRALRPLDAADSALLEAVGRGELAHQRPAQSRPAAAAAPDPARFSPRGETAVGANQPQAPHAHGLLQKVPRTHRYQVTAAGRKVITILTARQASVAQLTKAAA
jgi:hypothetical protein